MNNGIRQIDWSKWDSTEDCFAKYAHVKSKLVYGELPAEKPDVSVMIPTFRRANLLKEAIDSVLKQKTKYCCTISVIDNDAEGDEETDRLLKDYCEKYTNVLYYRNEQNVGMFGNWNRCIELSQTDWLCMLHDDDMLMENYIETLFPLTQGSNFGAVCGFRKILDQRTNSDLHRSETGKNRLTSFLMKMFIFVRNGRIIPLSIYDAAHNMFMPCTANLFNKSRVISLGGFNDIFSPSADHPFFAKIQMNYGAAFVPIPLYYYRINQNESFKMDTLWKAIEDSGNLPDAISKSLGMSERKCKKNRSEAILIVYNMSSDINGLPSINDVIKEFRLSPKYRSVWVNRWIMIKYNLRWGILLFRK